MLPVQYLAKAIQPNKPSHSVSTSPSGTRHMKQTFQSQFLHCVSAYLSSGILPPSDFGITIKSLHTKAVSDSKSLETPNRVFQTAFPQIAAEEANLPRLYSINYKISIIIKF